MMGRPHASARPPRTGRSLDSLIRIKKLVVPQISSSNVFSVVVHSVLFIVVCLSFKTVEGLDLRLGDDSMTVLEVRPLIRFRLTPGLHGHPFHLQPSLTDF